MQEGERFFGLQEGCPSHGDEHIHECSMCGAEFCSRCFPNSRVCSECAMQVGLDDLDDDTDPDFEDVEDLDALLAEDAEIEKILKVTEDMPLPPGFFEEQKAEQNAQFQPVC